MTTNPAKRALARSVTVLTPAPEIRERTAPTADAMPLRMPFRMRFATPTVGPKGLPEFPYVTSKVEFSAMVYTAIVWETTLNAASERIKGHWPHAVMQEAEAGVSTFKHDDTHLSSVQFGSVRVEVQLPWYRRLSFR